MAVLKMSEARYNDLVFLTLKYIWFEPAGFVAYGPRECDIRLVMELAYPPLLAAHGMGAVLLLSNEKAPCSHEKTYEVDTEKVWDAAKEYMEEHWFKMKAKEEWVRETKEEVWPKLIEAAMQVEEKDCGREEEPGEGEGGRP